jgi:sec-independent protein translocase protein TatA
MPQLGVWELVLIFVIIMVLFGWKRVPEMAKGLGEGIRNFKTSLRGDDDQKPKGPTPDGKS